MGGLFCCSTPLCCTQYAKAGQAEAVSPPTTEEDDGDADDFQTEPPASRRIVINLLFISYVAVSVGVPLSKMKTVSCENGFFWEDHMLFTAVFMTTKIAELWFYSSDDAVQGQLSLLSFMLKFLPSFISYADGYTDATSITIAHSCPDPLAQLISRGMLCCYVVGVLLLQFVVLACWAQSDRSHACLMKLVHMDALASCVTIPAESKKTWIAVSVARTVGEDIPQAVLQALFILYVKKNTFMMLSVCVSVLTSVKAVYDAATRTLKAVGATLRAARAAQPQDGSSILRSSSIPEVRPLSVSASGASGLRPLSVSASGASGLRRQ